MTRWFHPSAWWVSRKISELAELACDAAVLERVDDPAGYSRILLEFADAVSRTGRRVALPGLAMAAGSGMDRRIDRVFELSGGKLGMLWRLGVLAVLIGVPSMCLAATVELGESASQTVAQPKPAAKPKFEVISVKPSANCRDGGGRGGEGGGGSGSWSPGRLSLECRTVMNLLDIAYVQFTDGKRRPPDRGVPIEGGPSWINSERYDIDARAEGAPGREIMSGPMMQALLEDRFRLKIRREIRTVPIYELTVAPGGSKLHAAQEGKCINFDVNNPPPRPMPGQPRVPLCGSIGGPYTYGTTMAKLCLQLTVEFDQDVIDKTGIAGVFDIPFQWSPVEPSGVAAGDMAGPASRTDAEARRVADVQNSLAKVGLKLVRAKGSGAFLVIDHVERPSEN